MEFQQFDIENALTLHEDNQKILQFVIPVLVERINKTIWPDQSIKSAVVGNYPHCAKMFTTDLSTTASTTISLIVKTYLLLLMTHQTVDDGHSNIKSKQSNKHFYNKQEAQFLPEFSVVFLSYHCIGVKTKLRFYSP